MLRKLLVVCLVITLASCQIGGIYGPCSAVGIPGPFTEPISVFGTTVGAIASAISCDSDDVLESGTAWYSIVPESGDSVTVSSCSSYTNFDTVVFIYSGNCEDLTCVASGDDGDCAPNSLAGVTTFISTGQEYFIAVAGWGGASGQFELTISANANTSSTCQSAIAIPGPYVAPVTIFGNTQFAGGYGQDICGLTSTSHIDWYIITPLPESRVEVSTCSTNTNFDTRLSVFTGSCGSLVCQYENDDSNCTTSYYASSLTFVSDQPSYYVAVFGYSTSSGSYELSIVEQPVQNSGGACETLVVVPFAPGSTLLFVGSTVGNPVSHVDACSVLNSPSTWYKVDVPLAYSGTITASTCNFGTNFDTILSVYEGSCEDLRCVAQNDDYSCSDYVLSSTLFVNINNHRVHFDDRVMATPAQSNFASPSRTVSTAAPFTISQSQTINAATRTRSPSAPAPFTISHTQTRNAATATRSPSAPAPFTISHTQTRNAPTATRSPSAPAPFTISHTQTRNAATPTRSPSAPAPFTISQSQTRNAPTPSRSPSAGNQAETFSVFIQVAGFGTAAGSYSLSINFS